MPRTPRSLMVAVSVQVAGCSPQPSPSDDDSTSETMVASWTFEDERGPPLLQLWPAVDETPVRKKKDLRTSIREKVLVGDVDGKDPFFLWELATELRAAALSVELDASNAGSLQVFWTTARCPTFREECSATTNVGAGPLVVDILLPFPDPLRGIRLDLPPVGGASYRIGKVGLYDDPMMRGMWRGREKHTTATVERDGLHLDAAGDDGWATVDTPGLDATSVRSVDITLDGPEGSAPQLFWLGGPCGGFEERCSVRLSPTDGGAASLQHDLTTLETWKGRINALRLDPGDGPGRYVVERVTMWR